MTKFDRKYTSNPDFVLGAISVVNESNLLDVIEIICDFLRFSTNNQVKQKIYNSFVESFAKLFCNSFSKIVNACMVDIKHRKNRRKLINFIRKLFIDPIFVEAIKSQEIRYNSYLIITDVIDNVEKIFNKETALKLLKSDLPALCFLIFGHHPVLLEHPDLQQKWLTLWANSTFPLYAFNKIYVTDEAIKSVPFEDAFRFAMDFIKYYHMWNKSDIYFSLDTLKEILIIAVVSYGKNKQIEEALQNLELIKNKPLKRKRSKVRRM